MVFRSDIETLVSNKKLKKAKEEETKKDSKEKDQKRK